MAPPAEFPERKRGVNPGFEPDESFITPCIDDGASYTVGSPHDPGVGGRESPLLERGMTAVPR